MNGKNKDSIIEIDEDGLKKYLNVEIGRKLFQVHFFVCVSSKQKIISDCCLNNRAQHPGTSHYFADACLYFLEGWNTDGKPGNIIFSNMIMFSLFQDQVDHARNYYRRLMFLFIKDRIPDSSRLNATLHRVLKTVRDFAEHIRSVLMQN